MGWAALSLSTACGAAATTAPGKINPSAPIPASPAADAPQLPDLPLRGALDADLTLISILDFATREGRAMFAALDQVQNRLGPSRVRWLLFSRSQIDAPTDTVLVAVQERVGGAGSFAYLQALSERAAAGAALDFAERLQIGLSVARDFAARGQSRKVRLGLVVQDRQRDQHELEIDVEMAALAQREAAPCLLSINGVHVRGLPRTTQLEQLVTSELQMADALHQRGLKTREVFQQRVSDNQGQFIDLGPATVPRDDDDDSIDGEDSPELDPNDPDTARSNSAWRTL
jgi:hypothetical protein